MDNLNTMNKEILFNENVISYALYKNYFSIGSKIFFRVSHNIKIGRNWNYWCAPEVDVIEVTKDNNVIAYELKGVRKGRKKIVKSKEESPNFPAFYDGIGQVLAYLNLPYVNETDPSPNLNKFNGGAFDFVYLVYAREQSEFPEYERRILNSLPIGITLALPNGEFVKVKEASKNPLQSKEAKEHFLENLNTLDKFSINGKIFRKIKEQGERYFSKHKD